MKSKFIRAILTCLCLLVLVPMAPLADTPVSSPDNTAITKPGSHPLRQIDIEMKTIIDSEQAALTDLFTRFEAATDQQSAIEIQKEIRQLRIDTYVALLEVQVKRARRDGREAQAKKLEVSIEQIRNPEAMLQSLVKPQMRSDQGGVQ